jgi:hypothetical protein
MTTKTSQQFTEALSAQCRRDAERVREGCKYCEKHKRCDCRCFPTHNRKCKVDECDGTICLSPKLNDYDPNCQYCNEGIFIKQEGVNYYCPSCTPEYNRLMELSRKYTWHKPSGKADGLCSCGDEANPFSVPIEATCWRVLEHPKYTIEPVEGYESLVAILTERGEYTKFVSWLFDDNGEWREVGLVIDMPNDIAEILQTPELLMQAVMSFWNQREVGK